MEIEDLSVKLARDLAAHQPDKSLPNLAAALIDRADALCLAERWDEALDSVVEAVHLYQRLVAADPDEHRPALASALLRRSHLLETMGRFQEALSILPETVNLHRLVVDANSSVPFRENLALALWLQAQLLNHFDRTEPALASLSESLEHYHAVLADTPDRDSTRKSVASVLFLMTELLEQTGRMRDALTASSEEIALRRISASNDPTGEKTSRLAGSLNDQAMLFARADRLSEGLTAIYEAVDLYRQCSESSASDLAAALRNQSILLDRLGFVAKALTAITEAVNLYKQIAGYREELAESLIMQAELAYLLNDHYQYGFDFDPVEVINEAVKLYRQEAISRPDSYRDDLAQALRLQATLLYDDYELEPALESINEAEAIFRSLTVRCDSDLNRLNLARSLVDQADILGASDHLGEALSAATEAVELHRELAELQPEPENHRSLVYALEQLARWSAQTGNEGHAARLRIEAQTLREAAQSRFK